MLKITSENPIQIKTTFKDMKRGDIAITSCGYYVQRTDNNTWVFLEDGSSNHDANTHCTICPSGTKLTIEVK